MTTERVVPAYKPAQWPHVPLSPKEIVTLQLAAQDLTRAQIAKELGQNIETVKSRFNAMYKKIGVHNLGALVAWGYQHGYLLLPKERAPHADLRKHVKWLKGQLLLVQQDNGTLQAKVSSLEAEVRAAKAQLTSVPWRTTGRARV